MAYIFSVDIGGTFTDTVIVDDDLEFRQYYCPECATLLANEVIQSELEPVHDK